MTQATSLENLPTELSIHIMLDLGSLNALHAVICASPRMFQLFCAIKADILSHIARGSFHPSALLEALRIADIHEIERPLRRSTAIELLRVPIEERRQRLSTVSSIKQSTAICKVKNLTTFFIKDYAANTLPVLDQVHKCKPVATHYTTNSTGSSEHPLSVSEHARIERAFCRFELYALYFGQCIAKSDGCLQEWNQDRAVSARRQAEHFLFRYSASEVAEILCIRDYLSRRLRGVLNDVEDHAARVSRPSYFEVESKCATCVSGCPLHFQSDGRYDIWTHLEHITSLGLGYVRSILQAKTEDERTNLMLHGVNAGCHRQYPPVFMRYAAEQFGSDLDDNIRRMGTEYKYHKDAHGEWSQAVDGNGTIPPSPGWEWNCSEGSFLPSYGRLYAPGLKVWGYVFWDEDRLRKAGVLDRDPSELMSCARRVFGQEDLIQYDEERGLFADEISESDPSEFEDSDGTESEVSDGTESEDSESEDSDGAESE